MTNDRGYTVQDLSQFLEKTKSTIYRWIKEGKLEPEKTSGNLILPHTEKNISLIFSERRKIWDRPPSPYIPKELRAYSEWHEVIDEIGWLFKVCYNQKEDVKRKLFRLDIMFANYLRTHDVNLRKVRSVFSASQPSVAKVISNDLKRGWYNELAFAVPLKKSTLGLTFSDINLNKTSSNLRFAFPSWPIITAYYAVYFYLRSTTLQKFSHFRLQEHGATISSFKNNLLGPFERAIWKFPLNISYTPNERVYRDELFPNKIEHTRLKISHHPRVPNRNPLEIFEHIHGVFRKRSRAQRRPAKYTLFDYLHDFRVWANYLDIDNLLSLWGSGYKSFIDQNLSIILFFIGGISELCFIAMFGAKQYIKQLQNLYDLFALNNPELESEFTHTPLYQRLEIYNQFKLVEESIKLKSQWDINSVLLEL
jgi:hypothetical protein